MLDAGDPRRRPVADAADGGDGVLVTVRRGKTNQEGEVVRDVRFVKGGVARAISDAAGRSAQRRALTSLRRTRPQRRADAAAALRALQEGADRRRPIRWIARSANLLRLTVSAAVGRTLGRRKQEHTDDQRARIRRFWSYGTAGEGCTGRRSRPKVGESVMGRAVT